MIIKKILKWNYGNSVVLIILLLFILSHQSFAQWEKTNLQSTFKVNTLAISDSSIFAGTDGDGIFVSTDNGENWKSITEGLQNKIIHTLFINGTTIFAGTETGASVSTDHGLSWNTINSGLSGLGVWSFAVSNFIPGDTTIFAGTWSGVYTSTNNGKNWEATSLSNTTMSVHSIAAYNNFIFAATLGGGVFNSQSNGITWNDISIKYIDKNTGKSAIIPVYSLTILETSVVVSAGTIGNFYHAEYNDTHFKVCNSPSIIKPFLCFADRNTNLFAGNSNGYIYLSKDILNWKIISPPLINQAIYSLVLNKSYIFAGTVNGIWRLWYPDTSTNAGNFKEVPSGYILEQNFPNPFNPVTTIKYSIPNTKENNYSSVQLRVYNLLGQEVATLVNEQQMPGLYKVKFDGSNLTSGIYIYKLRAGSFISTKKLMLLK